MAVINNYGYTPVTITGVGREKFEQVEDKLWDPEFDYTLDISLYKGLIKTTSGDDQITFTADTFCLIDGISTGDGNDNIILADGKTEGEVILTSASGSTINTGAGNDNIYIGRFQEIYSLSGCSINTGTGADKLIGGEFSDIELLGQVNMGSGNDTLSTAYGGSFYAQTVDFGAGDDTLFIGAGSTFEVNSLNMGDGNDTLTVNGTLFLNGEGDVPAALNGVENIKGNGTVIISEDTNGNLTLAESDINRFLQAGINVINTVIRVYDETLTPYPGAYDEVEAALSNNTTATADEISPVPDDHFRIWLCGKNVASQHQYAFADSVDYYRFLKYGDDVEFSIRNINDFTGNFADDFAGVTLSILNSQGSTVATINNYNTDLSSLADGVYYLKAAVNADTVIAMNVELEYGDDSIPSADLQIAGLYLSDYDPAADESITARFRVCNMGSQSVQATTVGVYADGTKLGTVNVAALDARGFQDCTFTIAANKLALGAHTLEFKADDGNLVTEASENNTWRKSVTVQSPYDLCIQDYEVSSASIAQTGSVKLTFKYANKGTSAAAASVLKVYDGNTLLRTFSMGSVAAGSYRDATVTLQGSELGTGTRKIYLVVDANNQISESNEDNNKAYRTVTVSSPVDLCIQDYEVSSTSINKTGSVKLSFKYANKGTAAAGSSVLKVYDGNTLLRTFSMGSVEAGSYRDATVTLQGSELGTGARKIYLVVDANNQISESNEDNNKAYRTVTVESGSPDLCIQDYEVSSTSIDKNGSVKLSFKYANKGTAAAGASVLKVYDGNTLLRTFTMGSVEAGSFRDATVTLQGSELATGARNIYLVADADKQVTESNEDNNKAYRTVTVESGSPDLCIQDYEVSSTSIDKNGSVKLSFKYANKGTAAAGSSVLKVYDGNTLLRTFTMGSVEAGSFRNATVTLQGSELAAGARNIYLVADADKQVTESNEDNNKAYRTVTVESGSPDLCIQDYEVSSTSIDKNGSVKLSFKYANKGTAAAGSSVLKVYDGNTLLRTFTMGSVEAGSYRNATVTLQGSELADGARKIFLVVDANGQIAESNEDNNKAYRTVTVESAPAETSVELLTAWQAPATDNALDLTGWQDNNPPCESVSLEAENIFSNGYLNTLPLNSAVSSLAGDITSENDSLLKNDQGMLA